MVELLLDAGVALVETGQAEGVLEVVSGGKRGRSVGTQWRRWRETHQERDAPCEGQTPSQAR